MQDEEPLLTLEEVSKLLRVHKETLRRWSKNGRLKSITINDRGDRRYKQSEIKSFLERRLGWQP